MANPNISKHTTGEEDRRIHTGLDAAIYYRCCFAVQPGVEYYCDYFEHTGVIFSPLDLHLSPAILWNIGAGFWLKQPFG